MALICISQIKSDVPWHNFPKTERMLESSEDLFSNMDWHVTSVYQDQESVRNVTALAGGFCTRTCQLGLSCHWFTGRRWGRAQGGKQLKTNTLLQAPWLIQLRFPILYSHLFSSPPSSYAHMRLKVSVSTNWGNGPSTLCSKRQYERAQWLSYTAGRRSFQWPKHLSHAVTHNETKQSKTKTTGVVFWRN